MFDFNQNDQFLLNQIREGQKKQLWKNATILGVLLLTYNFLLEGLSYVYYFVYYTLKTGKLTLKFSVAKKFVYEKIKYYSVTEFEMLGNAFVTLVAVLVILFLARVVFKIKLGELFKCSKSDIAVGVKAFPFALLTNHFLTLIVSIITAMLASNGFVLPSADFSVDKPTFLAGFSAFMYMIVLAPIIEEVVYRGFVIKLFSPYGKALSVFISAFIFGLMHGNLSQFASAFLGGLVYACVALKTNSIMPTIIMHMMNNGLNALSMFAYDYSLDFLNEIYVILFSGVMLLGFLEIFMYRKILQKKPEETTLLTKKESLITVCTNPAMLLYLAYLMYEFIKQIVMANI